MESFLSLTQETARRYQEYREWPGPGTMDGLYQMRDRFDDVLDLSQVPPAARGEIAVDTFVLLWEVMARLELPPPEEIPGAPTEKESGLMEEYQADAGAEVPTRWRLPGTEIIIARVEDGPREGAFLFSPETVAGLRSFYEKVRDLPYLRPMALEPLTATQLLTGWMIPLKWVEALPPWANRPIFGLLLWKWFVLVLMFGLALGLVSAVTRWSRRGRWGGSVRSLGRRLSAPVLILVLNPVLGKFISEQINVSGEAAELPSFLIELASAIAIIWIVWLTSSWIAAVIIASPRVRAGSVDAHLIRLAARSVGILATLVLLIRAANEVGVPVYGIVAGAGVSGLAIALAAKTTLENFMGTLNLYADRPIRVGDLCCYGEDLGPDFQRLGVVEEIGLRSTRIRGLDRTLTAIPNAEFSNLQIVNLAKRDRMWINTTIGLRYETTPDQLRYVLATLREMLHAHPKTIHTIDAPISVRFAGFGDYSLDVFIRVYIRATTFYELLPIKEDILLRVMESVENAGLLFRTSCRTAG